MTRDDFIRKLAEHHIFGGTEQEVREYLLDRAIEDLVEREFVGKHFEAMKLLKGRE